MNDDRRKSDIVEAILDTSKINNLSTTQQIKLQMTKESLCRMSIDQLQQSLIPQMVMKNYTSHDEDIVNRMYEDERDEDDYDSLMIQKIQQSMNISK